MYWKKITYSKSQLYLPLNDNVLHYITKTHVVNLQSYLGGACSWQQWHEQGTVVVWDVWQQRGTTQTCLNPQHHTPMCHQSGYQGSCQTDVAWGGSLTDLCWDGNVETPKWGPLHWNRQDQTITTSVAYRYRKSISIIELLVSIISIYISGSWQLIFSDLYRNLPGGR